MQGKSESRQILDLPYVYNYEGKLKMYNPARVAYKTMTALAKNYMLGDVDAAKEAFKLGVDSLIKGDYCQKIAQETRGTMADVAGNS